MRALIRAIGMALAAAGIGAALAGAAVERPAEHGRCFPAKQWGPAPDRLRPCAQIVRVAEDGSVRVRVLDASGRARYAFDVGARDR